MNEKQSWKTSWSLFVDDLERALQSGASNVELSELFGGHQVQWSGTIEQIDFDDLSAVVDVALPVRTVKLGSGVFVRLDGLTLAVAESDTAAWENFKVGDEVVFTAVLGRAKSPFSSIELKTLRSGKCIILIQIDNALPASSPTD